VQPLSSLFSKNTKKTPEAISSFIIVNIIGDKQTTAQ
jgi:hypothetical protein